MHILILDQNLDKQLLHLRRCKIHAAARKAAKTLEAEEVIEAVVEEITDVAKNETVSTDTIAVNASAVIPKKL